MPTYKTPDVYVEEISGFPPSVAEVETAIPAFIGYTEKAKRLQDDDLLGKPKKIYSFTEFESYFGKPQAQTLGIDVTGSVDAGFESGNFKVDGAAPTSLTLPSYLMWYAAKLYFDNGGGKCYVISVGKYADPAVIDDAELKKGLATLAFEDEPTLIVIPDAVHLDGAKYQGVVQEVLLQCSKLMDRFGIFDIHNGGEDLENAVVRGDLTANRAFFGMNHLKYGAAYYPFLRSTLNHHVKEDYSNVEVDIDGAGAVTLDTLKDSTLR